MFLLSILSNCSREQISPIFLTTVDVTGGIGLDLQNWVKVVDEKEMQFVMKMGCVFRRSLFCSNRNSFTINTKTKKLYNGDKELKDISKAFTPQKMEFIKAGWFIAFVFGKSYKLCFKTFELILFQFLLLQKKFLSKDKDLLQ
jgi:aconitase B